LFADEVFISSIKLGALIFYGFFALKFRKKLNKSAEILVSLILADSLS